MMATVVTADGAARRPYHAQNPPARRMVARDVLDHDPLVISQVVCGQAAKRHEGQPFWAVPCEAAMQRLHE
jgi:hypothetical protein